MSRAVHFTISVLAWLSLPLWPLAVAGAWIFTVKGEIAVCSAMVAATPAWSLKYVMHRIEGLVKRMQDGLHVRETALIKAIDTLANGPEDAGEAEPTKLRAAS